MAHRKGDGLHRHCFEQPQDLDELAFAPVAHPRLEQVAQMLEDWRKIPALQCGGLIERARLGLDQREIERFPAGVNRAGFPSG